MKLRSLSIRNFRALEDVHIDGVDSARAIVIAGPNAIGKTTVLEAIRALKVILAPTYQTETQEGLRDMGAMPQGLPSIEYGALAKDISKPLTVECEFILDDRDFELIRGSTPRLALQRLADRLGIGPDEAEVRMVPYLSSDEGQQALDGATQQVTREIEELERKRIISPSLEFSTTTKTARGKRLLDQHVWGLLGRQNNGYLGLVNYFPADRAMPSGEAAIQVGTQDFNQQIRSHIAMPATKYNRLKNYLVTRYLSGDEERKEVEQDFKSVFSDLLFDKDLNSISLTRSGRLSVLIREPKTGALFDIDRMSSGEKGLLLTVFLMKRTTARGGLILLDEPELHLNASVCQRLLKFLIQKVISPIDAQAIICTHSEEILASAYEDGSAQLFRLRSPRDISRIELKDREELADALRALGSSTVGVLFTKGTIYSEGLHDEELLQAGFADLLQGFRVISLGGRSEVEKQIKTLQKTEKEGKLDTFHCFIFDRDRSAASLSSTDFVKLNQLDRYCLENYLMDADAVYDAIKDIGYQKGTPSRGSLPGTLKELAIGQLSFVVANEIYQELEPENAGIRHRELKGNTNYDAIGNILASRIESIKDQLDGFQKKSWITNFVKQCNSRDQKLRPVWENDWVILANGKEVINACRLKYEVKCSDIDFKITIMKKLKARHTDEWNQLNDRINNLINPLP